jgi:hypothetical protein
MVNDVSYAAVVKEYEVNAESNPETVISDQEEMSLMTQILHEKCYAGAYSI